MNALVLLTVPYEITCAPLTLVDTQIARRLPQDSPPRLAFDRALGTYDQLAGRLLANEAIAQQGTDRLRRSSNLAQATVLEREAAARREQAAQVGQAGRDSAQQKRQAAQQRAEDGLDAAQDTERRGKQAAASDARGQAARDKQAIQQRTDERSGAIRQGLTQSDQAANARQTAARKTAKAKLDDVAETKGDARSARADANKLGDLADAKENERKASPPRSRGRCGHPAGCSPKSSTWVIHVLAAAPLSVADALAPTPIPERRHPSIRTTISLPLAVSRAESPTPVLAPNDIPNRVRYRRGSQASVLGALALVAKQQ